MDRSFKTSEVLGRAEIKFVFDQPLKIDVHALRCVFSLTFVFEAFLSLITPLHVFNSDSGKNIALFLRPIIFIKLCGCVHSQMIVHQTIPINCWQF